MTPQQTQTILAFMKAHPLSIIATNSSGSAPESALVAFAELPDLGLLFQTRTLSRKYANLTRDPKVSFVIGGSADDHRTLQYEGIAKPVEPGDLEKYIEIFVAKKTPTTETFLRHPDARVYKVTPTWLRYSDYTTKPPAILEHTFPAADQQE